MCSWQQKLLFLVILGLPVTRRRASTRALEDKMLQPTPWWKNVVFLMVSLAYLIVGSHSYLLRDCHCHFGRDVSVPLDLARRRYNKGSWLLAASGSWCQDTLVDAFNPYRSMVLFPEDADWEKFMRQFQEKQKLDSCVDPFWEQTKLEALAALKEEPEAGPQLYQGILLHQNLLEAICTRISHDIETELIPATAVKNLFLETLTVDDEAKIRMDLQAVATRSPSNPSAMGGLLFHNGFHALVCYRVGHRLWQTGRRELAVYMQSTVSRTYSADIHPACRMGSGIYVRVGAGVVLGETAVVGNDVSILEGVTLGGTGKEAGERHPKVGNGVLIQEGGTVLGNIRVGDGAVVSAKSIVTKPIPPLAIVSGVPASVRGYRSLDAADYQDDLQEFLVRKYFDEWRQIEKTLEFP